MKSVGGGNIYEYSLGGSGIFLVSVSCSESAI